MDALKLFLLGRTLMKIGEEAMRRAGHRQAPTSIRTIVIDVYEHPGSSVGEIAKRTGYPQSHVSAALARLRESGTIETEPDPRDRRRTLARLSPELRRRAAERPPVPVEEEIREALGEDGEAVGEVMALLEGLSERLTPVALSRLRGGGEESGKQE